MVLFGWFVLFSWPVVAYAFFRRFDPPVAVILTVLAGYLLLPNGLLVNMPVLPEFNKTTIPVLSALVLSIVTLRNTPGAAAVLPGWIPRNPVIIVLLAVLLGGTFGTVLTNRDVLVYGPRVLPALRLYDGFSVVLELLVLLIPFFLGRKLLAGKEAQRSLLTLIVFAALIYSVPTLYEVRMSPQLHLQVYGFFPHAFYQHMRGEGFRPVVFMGHGLVLSLFMAFSVIAAVGIMQISKAEDRLKWMVVAIWLFAVLVLTKSLGPLLITLMLLPVLLFLKVRMQLLVLASIAGALLLYPALRAAHLVPVDQIMAFAHDISPDRAASFMTRLENEEILLAKAQQRPWFGWGIWGRQRVFDEFGNNFSITDGTWIIELGVGGWVRYIGFMGLLCWPVIAMAFAKREKIDPICVLLTVMVTAKLIDLIPNSGVPALNWLMVGALVGRLEMRQRAEAPADVPDKSVQKASYARKAAAVAAKVRGEAPRHTRRFSGDDKKNKNKPAAGRSRGSDTPYRRPNPGTGYRR